MSNSSTSLKPLVSLTVTDFARRLASSEPTPGGGSAAALAGCLGASLVSMVGGLTAGRAGFEEQAETCEVLVEQGDQIAETLSRVVDEDAAAYGAVMGAFGMPKADDEQKQARSAAIQAAMRGAADVPLRAAEECLAAAELALVALEKGNPNASSDAGVGMLLALAGMEGAVLNVATNLDSIKDAAYAEATREELRRMVARGQELRETMWEAMTARIKSLPA